MAGNTYAPDNDSPLQPQEETHRPLLMSTLVIVALAAVFGFALALFRIDERLGSHSIGKELSDVPGAVGTLGRTDTSARSLPEAELVFLSGNASEPRPGQKARVTVRASQLANAATFWAGLSPRDILVVIERDQRTQEDRDSSRPADRAFPVDVGAVVQMEGVIEPVPSAEGMFSWGLTEQDRRRVADRGVYLRVDQVAAADAPLSTKGSPSER